jgi:diaminopimelate epimerase
MSARAFEKVEGLGNDFVLMHLTDDSAFDRARVPQICDRHTGVGADGVLLVSKAQSGGDARMEVINADGSVPEMCGNGLRCVALSLAAHRGVDRGELRIETDAGVRVCQVERRGDEADVEVDMGVVRVLGQRTLFPAGVLVELTLADAGNPHAVAYRQNLARDIEALGLLLSTDPSFERGTNVELVRWQDDVLEVAVWERGAGRTLACGTGACAVVAVACARGEAKSGQKVRVRLPGGELVIAHDMEAGLTRMLGPARRVFTGELPG